MKRLIALLKALLEELRAARTVEFRLTIKK
jgi:hypothetical protein